VDIAPFAALRYAKTGAGELDRCISLPYDQFGDEGRDERYARHPHNIVRLIKPRPARGEAPHDLAGRTLSQWRQEGILQPDPRPALYPYRQQAVPPGGAGVDERWGFICRLRLTPFDSGPVKPHERTFPDTVGERCRLRELVGADLGLILVVYDDPGGLIDAQVRRARAIAPLLEATDEVGTANALWELVDGQPIEALREAISSASGFIADGHHRYTAALAHWQSRGADPEDPAGWVMASLVSAASEGLRILPTHRLVEAAPGEEASAGWANAGLRITPVSRGATPEATTAAAHCALMQAAEDHSIAVVRRDGGEMSAELVHAPRGSLVDAPWRDGVPGSWRDLDVPVLHSLMLEPWLGALLASQTEDHGAIDYCNDYLDSVQAVAEGSYGAAFLTNALTVNDVQRVVAAGDVLPPKSTNFFPKVIAGLTIHSFDDAMAP